MALQSKNKIVRVWDISQIRSKKDAQRVLVDDTIIFKLMEFKVTWVGEDINYAKDVIWCGKVKGENPYGIIGGQIICWGPNGMARSFPDYKDKKFLDGKSVKLTEKIT